MSGFLETIIGLANDSREWGESALQPAEAIIKFNQLGSCLGRMRRVMKIVSAVVWVPCWLSSFTHASPPHLHFSARNEAFHWEIVGRGKKSLRASFGMRKNVVEWRTLILCCSVKLNLHKILSSSRWGVKRLLDARLYCFGDLSCNYHRLGLKAGLRWCESWQHVDLRRLLISAAAASTNEPRAESTHARTESN